MLTPPWSVRVRETARINTLLSVANVVGCTSVIPVFESLEPDVPWTEVALRRRAECYQQARHPLAEPALEDLEWFREHAPVRLISE